MRATQSVSAPPPADGHGVPADTATVGLDTEARPSDDEKPRQQVVAPAAFRLCLLGLCLLVTQAAHVDGVLIWLAALLLLTGLSFRREDTVMGLVLLVVEIAVVCAGVTLTGGATSPLLAYLPAPLLAAGLGYGRRYTLGYGAQALALLIAGRLLTGSEGGSWQAFLAVAAQWVVLSVAVGVLADRIRRFPTQIRTEIDASYEEALLLLSQLRSVTRRLPGSLDPLFVAESILDTCQSMAEFATAAVLVHSGEERLAPLATRGMHRVPWRDPLTTPGPLQTAWLDAVPVLDVRFPDTGGRRSGSALVAIPMPVADRVIGLVVLESAHLDAFPSALIDTLNDAVLGQALRLGTAVVFEEFQAYASMEERGRLAREMHDGVGQDLASIGFELDELRHHLEGDETAVDHVSRVREHVSDIVRDIRLSITELQSGEALSRGLGAALTSHVRAAGAGGGFAVHLSLNESTFRLPADSEAELLRIAQELTSAARRRFSAENLWVSLQVDPPAAILRLEHDGRDLQDFPENADLLRQRVSRVGGRMQLGDQLPSRVSVQITLGEMGGHDSRPGGG